MPFLQVAKHHDLPPTATYSSLVLWNFAFQSPFCDLTDPSNLHSLLTVTGLKDEEWFYLISVALESRGGPIVLELLNCMEAVRRRDEADIVASLIQTTRNIQQIGLLLERMYERCDPQTYYHDIRPLLAGTKGMATSGLPKGVFFDEGDGRGEWHQHSGGSNGQSSLIQLLDIALGVDHYATGEHRGRSSEAGPKSKANGYIKVSKPFHSPPGNPLRGCLTDTNQEMRKYMPGPHRAFLAYVEKTTNIRDYAFSSAEASEAVRNAYAETVTALSKFRDVHIQIVTRYIITPSKTAPAAHVKRRTGLNLASASSSAAKEVAKMGEQKEKPQLYGTGGTDLIPFLKQTRDETREAARV